MAQGQSLLLGYQVTMCGETVWQGLAAILPIFHWTVLPLSGNHRFKAKGSESSIFDDAPTTSMLCRTPNCRTATFIGWGTCHAWQDAVAIANEAKSIVNDAKKAADAAVTSSAEAAKQAAEAAKQAAEAAKQAAEAAKQAAEAMKKLTQAVHELKKGEDDARKAAPCAPETITGEFDIPDGDLDGLITRLKQRGWRIQPGDSSKAEKLIATLPKSTAPSYTTCLTVQSTWVCSSPLVITQYVYPQVYAIPARKHGLGWLCR